MSDHERSSESESQTISRRAAIKKTVNAGLAAGAVMSAPSWVLPALAQGEELVPFSDMPEDYSRPPARPGGTHFLDTRQISSDSFYTDNQDFYVVQHYGQPELDLSSYRLQITGWWIIPSNIPSRTCRLCRSLISMRASSVVAIDRSGFFRA